MNNALFQQTKIQPTSFHLAPTLQPGAKILFVSDGADEDWRANHTKKPLVSGVKRFSETMVTMLRNHGYQVDFLHPYILNDQQKRIIKTNPLKLYPDTEVASYIWEYLPIIQRFLTHSQPDAIFIATVEGPLGFFTSWLAKNLNIPYSLAFTTNYHEYVGKYLSTFTNGLIDLPSDLPIFKTTYKLLYQNAKNIFVPTQTIARFVETFGIEKDRIILWPRGIDTKIFHPPTSTETNPYLKYKWYQTNPLPILIYFGRISIDKRIDDFLNLSHSKLETTLGTKVHKVIIGAGLQDQAYQSQYANQYTHFLGGMKQSHLAEHLRWSNVFIFPSVTDTFGNVILESSASGVPVVGRVGKNIASTEVLQAVGGIGVEIDPNLGTILKKTAQPIENYPDLYKEDQEKWLAAITKAFNQDRKNIVTTTTQKYSWENAMHLLLKHI